MNDNFEIFHPGESPDYTMAIVYGDPGVGKSRFITSLPTHLGKILLIASDSKGESLKSVLPAYRDRIIVVNPFVKSGSRSKIDPVQGAFQIAMTDWKEKYPDMGVLVWDTISTTGKSMLRHTADLGKYTKNPMKFDIAEGETITNPTEGDYGATQDQLERMMDLLSEQSYHVIIAAHAGIAKTKEGSIIGGGPMTVGQAQITTFGGRFNPMVYLTRKVRPALGKDLGGIDYFAHTEPVGIFNAKIREDGSGGNRLAHVKLEADPVHFWNDYFTHY